MFGMRIMYLLTCCRRVRLCVDFVLVYEELIDLEEKKIIGFKKTDFERNEKWRQKFMRNLDRMGVQHEEVVSVICSIIVPYVCC